MLSLEKNIQEFIATEEMFRKGERIIVGVSGGADSACLLNILYKLRYTLGIEIIIAHLDHSLRKNSRRDEIFVRKTAESLKLPFISKTLEPLKTKKGSVEDYARKQRHKFFKSCAKKFKTSTIALAHNQNDLAETVLMRILRGTGTEGLMGILAIRSIDELKIVRPLLQTSRKDILKYLSIHRLKFVNDPTNQTLDFTRNKIRHQLLPLLEKSFNPNIKSTLITLADTNQIDFNFLKSQSQREYTRCLIKENGREVVFHLKKIKTCHPAMTRMIIREAFAHLKGNTGALDFFHTKTVMDAIENPDKSTHHLPQGIYLHKDIRFLRFTKLKLPRKTVE